MTNTLFHVSPEVERPTFVAANSFLANITAFVGPILGTTLATATTIQLALVIAGVIRLLGGVSFWALGVGPDTQGPTGWRWRAARRREGAAT